MVLELLLYMPLFCKIKLKLLLRFSIKSALLYAFQVLVEKMGHPEGSKFDEAPMTPKSPKSPKNDVLRK